MWYWFFFNFHIALVLETERERGRGDKHEVRLLGRCGAILRSYWQKNIIKINCMEIFIKKVSFSSPQSFSHPLLLSPKNHSPSASPEKRAGFPGTSVCRASYKKTWHTPSIKAGISKPVKRKGPHK